jgi:hypothetical protein
MHMQRPGHVVAFEQVELGLVHLRPVLLHAFEQHLLVAIAADAAIGNRAAGTALLEPTIRHPAEGAPGH